MSLCDYLEKVSHNTRVMDKIALVKAVTGPSVTYRSMFAQARKLSLTFARNSVISSVIDNSVENAVIFLAITAGGSAIAPLNPNLLESEYEFFLKKSPGGLVVSDKGTAAERCARRLGIPIFFVSLRSDGSVELTSTNTAIPTVSLPAENEALILYTSGTTGTPKCVALTHSNLIASIKNIIAAYQLCPSDITIAIMPLFHIHGLMASLFATLGSGGTVVFPGKFSASNFFQQAQSCTWFSAVPTMLHIIASTVTQPMPKLRFIRSCSSSLAPSLLREIETKFKVQVLEAYAMTEAAHQMTSNPLGKRKAGTVGIPHGQVEIRIFDGGEVCVRGPNVISAYKGNIAGDHFYESADKKLFFRTGDQGYLDEDGYLVLTGRLKELINRGGEKISPIEVDSAILSHPSVSEAVSFGIPDKKYGETVGAAVVVKSNVSSAEIINFLKTKLSTFKIPTQIFFVKHMPKTDTGKIQRRKVAEVCLKNSKL